MGSSKNTTLSSVGGGGGGSAFVTVGYLTGGGYREGFRGRGMRFEEFCQSTLTHTWC